MKDTTQLRKEIGLLNDGITDLLKALNVKRPMSIPHVRNVLEDLLVHSGSALFILDCLEGGVPPAAMQYHPGT